MPTLNQLACTPALNKAIAMFKLTLILEADLKMIVQAIIRLTTLLS
jgi:hypothetical protein